MDAETRKYWLDRWQRRETAWQQSAPEPAFIEHFSRQPETRVLVPLCGKSPALAWLISRGHEVLGVELSEQACRELLGELGLPWSQARDGRFLRFRAPGLALLCGDFFELDAAAAGSIGSVYDRAALVALPSALRPRYARQLAALARASAGAGGLSMLLSVFERDPPDELGPPYSVSAGEVRALYGRDFEIRLVNRSKTGFPNFDPARTEICEYELRLR